MARPLPHPRVLRTASVVLVATLLAARASADEGCHVELAGDASPAWRAAVRALEERIAQGRIASDCASITVRTSGKRAGVSYATTDGRVAEREVGAPRELAATVSALGTMIPLEDPAEETDAPAPAPEQAPASSDVETPDRAPASPETKPPDPLRADVVYGVLGGAKAGAGGLVSAVFDLYAAIGLDRWQLGILGRVEPRYKNVLDTDQQPRSSVFAAGVTMGRRVPVGSNVLIVAGGSFLVAAIHEDRSRKNEQNQTRADPRVAAFVGLILPRREKMRFRANLTAELTPQKKIERSAEGLDLTPWWSVGLTAGVELGGP